MSQSNRRGSGVDFPCVSLDGALPHLRRPPVPEAVHFKIQNTAGDCAQIAAYLDARLVYDRLDLVCGRAWTARFAELPERMVPPAFDRDGQALPRPPLYVRCRLTALGVTREDVGEGEDPKAAFSDAVKRAAVHFGVGRALYALHAPWLKAGRKDGELRRNSKRALFIDERSERWLREQYARWLERRGRRLFGEPIDHAPGAESAAKPRQTSDEADAVSTRLHPVEDEGSPDRGPRKAA